MRLCKYSGLINQRDLDQSLVIIISMGIVRLGQFLKTKFSHVLHKRSPQQFKHKLLAVDASSTIYSFLAKTITFTRNNVNIPTDSHGNQTGHLIGLLYRVLLCKEQKIQTVWVFDGKPPQHKFDQIYRRRQLKEEALSRTEDAKQIGDIEEAVRQSKRTIFVSRQQKQDAQTLLKLIGLPVVQAASEGQAQCAWLAKNKFVEGVIGEDMDTLVFGSPELIKNFNRDNFATQIILPELLATLGLTYQQFVDFSILCGCDYTAKIPMVGPVKALTYIKTYGNLEKTVQFLQSTQKLRSKHPIPDDFNYLIARKLFQKPLVFQTPHQELVKKPFEEEQLRAFLMEKNFDENRVNNWIKKVKQFDSRADELL